MNQVMDTVVDALVAAVTPIFPATIKEAETLAAFAHPCTYCDAGVNQPCRFKEAEGTQRNFTGRIKLTAHRDRRALGTASYAAWIAAMQEHKSYKA